MRHAWIVFFGGKVRRVDRFRSEGAARLPKAEEELSRRLEAASGGVVSRAVEFPHDAGQVSMRLCISVFPEPQATSTRSRSVVSRRLCRTASEKNTRSVLSL